MDEADPRALTCEVQAMPSEEQMMDESVVIARRRQEALDLAARILGVRPPMPSAKDEPGLREAYMAELILALAERVSGEPGSKEAGVASGPPFRIPD